MTKDARKNSTSNLNEEINGFDYFKQIDTRNRRHSRLKENKKLNPKEEQRVNFIKDKKEMQREDQQNHPVENNKKVF
jgi:hypothetical protein